MAKIKKRGVSGAAKNYITRTQALKKLQISLSDFRRLCILKGIYPREPVNKKKANKGSSAPASFYYSKDIMYLLHEPLLAKFREHKTFAKKLARALGRQEWALAKGLEERKPIARLDHLVKERYPTFGLALKDLSDPLSLLSLFMGLPNNPVPGRTTVPVEVIAETGRLISEWKVWAIRTNSLRKVFLSIKGVYYECEVPAGAGGEVVQVRWLEPWEFKQNVPTDVDFRILLTFLDLYRTLVSFTLFKLYTDENLVYPPPLDVKLDESGEGIGKFRLVEKDNGSSEGVVTSVVVDGKRVTKKEVKKGIRAVTAASNKNGTSAAVDGEEDVEMEDAEEDEEEFIHHPSKTGEEDPSSAPLPTYTSLLASTPAQLPSSSSLLFSQYTFYLSRETSSRTWEFVIRSFGGRVVTSLSASTPSQAAETESITHVLIDRPMEVSRMREMESGRKWTWVQPQWVADCVNQKKILPSGNGSGYEPGGALPPHLSPWEGEGEVVRPWLEDELKGGEEVVAEAVEVVEGGEEEEEEEDEDEEDSEEEKESSSTPTTLPPALAAAALDPSNETLLHAAELEAEANAVPHATFRSQLKEATKVAKASGKAVGSKKDEGEDLRKIMMTGKKQKLYEKMQYGNNERKQEKEKLEQKRQIIQKRKKEDARKGKKA